jgi:hypothetical protein
MKYKILWAGCAWCLALLMSDCAEAQPNCGRLERPESKEVVFSSERGGSLILAPKGTRARSPDKWQGGHELAADCYDLGTRWKGARAVLAVNNHVDDSITADGHALDVGVQILKLRFRRNGGEPQATVQAFRSEKRPWFRGAKEAKKYGGPKDLGLSIKGWSDAHDSLNVLQQTDRSTRGQFHAAPSASGRSTYDNKEWWRVNDKIVGDFDVVLENRLFSFLPASGELAGGVPFEVSIRDADIIVVRFKSTGSAIDGMVTLCLDRCDLARSVSVQSMAKGIFAQFFSRLLRRG